MSIFVGFFGFRRPGEEIIRLRWGSTGGGGDSPNTDIVCDFTVINIRASPKKFNFLCLVWRIDFFIPSLSCWYNIFYEILSKFWQQRFIMSQFGSYWIIMPATSNRPCICWKLFTIWGQSHICIYVQMWSFRYGGDPYITVVLIKLWDIARQKSVCSNNISLWKSWVLLCDTTWQYY